MLMSNSDSIEQYIQIAVEFEAFNIIIDHIPVGPWGSVVQGTGQNPLQSLSSTEVTLYHFEDKVIVLYE